MPLTVAIEVLSRFRHGAVLAMRGVGAVGIDGIGDSRRVVADFYDSVGTEEAGGDARFLGEE